MAENTPYVSGLFPDRDSAERAWQGTLRRGYEGKDIALAMSDETRKRHFSGDTGTELGTMAAEGAGVGAGIGGAIGAIAAAIAAVGTTLVVPGLGLVVAGPLAAALAGAGAGGAAGGLVGALIGWNIPEEHVKRYEAGIREGGIVMGVQPRSEDDARTLADEWRSARGSDVYHGGTSSSNASPSSASSLSSSTSSTSSTSAASSASASALEPDASSMAQDADGAPKKVLPP